MDPHAPGHPAPRAATGPRDVLLGRAVDWFAQHGVGDTSLRTLAAGIDSSHRMLLYHFGSREGLLAEVATEVWQRHRSAFEALAGGADGPADPPSAAWAFWSRLADQVELSALYFELSAAAMQGHAWAVEPVRRQLAQWQRTLADFFERLGNPPDEAALLARTSMAVTRGALELLALDGDRAAADAVVAGYLAGLERGPSASDVVEQLR